MKLLVALIIAVAAFTSSASAASKGCYRAAAYEHVLVGAWSPIDRNNPLQFVRKNLKAFAIAAEAARDEGAEIIVFPEEGLHVPVKIKGENCTLREGTKLLMEDVPHPRDSDEPIVPCGNKDFDDREIVQTLSCIAKSNSIYLVADMGDIKNCADKNDTNCPDDGVYMYNTQVAFDRKGALVGRYHKYHLYGEYHYNVPDEVDLSYFDTDFGVRVGMYICFDRLFHDPMVKLVEEYNVTTMALSTWFFDEYPLLISTQIDQGWSIGLGINIVAANSKQLDSGTTGSGIFSPSYVAISEHDVGKNKQLTRPRLIIGNLPVDPKSHVKCDPDPWTIGISKFKQVPAQKYSFFGANFSKYESIQLTDDKGDNVTLCQGDFCCSLDYQFKKNSGKHPKNQADYYFAVSNGMRDRYFESQYQMYEQVCLVLAYDGEKATYPMTGGRKFKSLTIRGSFDTKYVYPSALSNDFELVPTQSIKLKVTEGEKHERKLNVRTKRPVISASLHGRVYERDPPYVQHDFGDEENLHSGNLVSGAQ